MIVLLLALQQAPIQAISWYQPMLEALGAIADTAHIEHYRCLLGVQRADTLYVMAAWEPKIKVATALFIAPAEPCPPLITVGEWHNHRPRTITAMGEDLGQTWPLAVYCELSREDRRSEQHPLAPPLQLISVTRNVSCAWALHEGRYARMLQWPPGDPP